MRTRRRALDVAVIATVLLGTLPLLALAPLALRAAASGRAAYVASKPRVLAPGVTYSTLRSVSKRNPEVVHVVSVAPTAAVRPLVSLSNDQVAEPDPGQRLERTSAACVRWDCVAGVNGDFFCTSSFCPQDIDEPEGGIVSDGRMLRSPGSVGWQEQQLTFDPNGCPQAPAPLSWSGSLTAAAGSLSIDGVNVDRHADQAVLYDAEYGPATPPATKGVELVLQLADPAWLGDLSADPVPVTATSLIAGNGSYPVPPGSGVVVISASGSQATLLRSMWTSQPAGQPMQLQLDTTVPVTDSIGAKPLLVLNGQYTGQWGNESHVARTMFAWRADCTRMLITVDGPSAASRGMSMQQEAALAVALGATTAFGLDGGPSTTLVGAGGKLLDKPSYGGSGDRPTGSSLLFVHHVS